MPAAPLGGRVVIDTGNYYPQRDGQIADLDSTSLTSSELLQRHLPGAEAVKAFNNIFFKHLRSLARPAGAAKPAPRPTPAPGAPRRPEPAARPGQSWLVW